MELLAILIIFTTKMAETCLNDFPDDFPLISFIFGLKTCLLERFHKGGVDGTSLRSAILALPSISIG